MVKEGTLYSLVHQELPGYDTDLPWHLKYRHWAESWIKPRDESISFDQYSPMITTHREPKPSVEMLKRMDNLESRLIGLEGAARELKSLQKRHIENLQLHNMTGTEQLETIDDKVDFHQKSVDELEKCYTEGPKKVTCPVCYASFSSLLDFERHITSDYTANGEHTQWLEELLGKPFAEFGWKSEKEMAIVLTNYWRKYQKWPE